MERSDLADDPMEQVRRWLAEAEAAGIVEPNAMSVATADVAVRTVLLRGVDQGFVFYTNYHSAKARALDAHPVAAVSLTWPALGRQVRAVGRAERVAEPESDAYWAGRPRGSQVAAWASPQSSVLADRAELDRLYQEALARFGAVEPVPRPPHWGGYRVVPDEVEFWCRGENRMHDRLRFSREGEAWRVDRLAP
jgi:pyridoxamine 5'-phosphate oxidase